MVCLSSNNCWDPTVAPGIVVNKDSLAFELFPPLKKERPRYDIKRHLIVRLRLWRSGDFQELLHCDYSQV